MEFLLPELGFTVWIILILLIFILPIIALVDVIRSSFKDSTVKLIWILIILFLPFAGSVIYFLLGRSQRVYNNY